MHQKVAVIGAGAAGLAAVDYFMADGIRVELFECRSKPAVVWNAENGSIVKHWDDPVYDALQTNVPRTLMTFSGHKWENATSLFPPHHEVKDYLQRYANKLEQSGDGQKLRTCHYNTEVASLRKIRGAYRKWQITPHSKEPHWGAKVVVEDPIYFDAVVIATGNYDSFDYPDAEPGRNDWNAAYRGSLMAAFDFKDPSVFTDKTVVIVGNGPSGWNISVQLKGIAKRVIMSVRRPQAVSDGVALTVGTIDQYYPAARGIQFQGNVCVSGIDHIIYCTGYQYSFPFFKQPTKDQLVIPYGKKVENLYEHISYVQDPSVAFVGLPKMAAAFTIAEAQSAYVARISSGRLKLPPKREMQDAADKQEKACKAGQDDIMSCTTYHTLAPSLDKEYVNYLATLSAQAVKSDNDTNGKPPPFWCQCLDNARAQLRALRDEHKAMGEQRHEYNTYESLGYYLHVPCEGDARNNIIKGCKSCCIP